MIIQFLFTIILLQSFLFHGIQFQYQVQLIINGVQSVLYPSSHLANYIPSLSLHILYVHQILVLNFSSYRCYLHMTDQDFFSCKFKQINLVEVFDRTVGLHSTWNEIAHQLMYFKSFYHSIYPEWVVFITILTCELLNHLTRARSNYISIDSRLP